MASAPQRAQRRRGPRDGDRREVARTGGCSRPTRAACPREAKIHSEIAQLERAGAERTARDGEQSDIELAIATLAPARVAAIRADAHAAIDATFPHFAPRTGVGFCAAVEGESRGRLRAELRGADEGPATAIAGESSVPELGDRANRGALRPLEPIELTLRSSESCRAPLAAGNSITPRHDAP